MSVNGKISSSLLTIVAPAPQYGTSKSDTFIGSAFADIFFGGQGSDFMYGGDGSDRLYGGSGRDVLVGGNGKDWLTGGSGADSFIYNNAGEAGRGASSDVITDFKSGVDHIDLHAFMAGGLFIDAAAFTAGGGAEVNYDQNTGRLFGDVNGDGVADFSIVLANHAALAATDFIF